MVVPLSIAYSPRTNFLTSTRLSSMVSLVMSMRYRIGQP